MITTCKLNYPSLNFHLVRTYHVTTVHTAHSFQSIHTVLHFPRSKGFFQFSFSLSTLRFFTLAYIIFCNFNLYRRKDIAHAFHFDRLFLLFSCVFFHSLAVCWHMKKYPIDLGLENRKYI